MGGAGQAMADGNKQNCTSHKPCDLNNPTHQPRLPAVCEKNVFRFIHSSASGKPHLTGKNIPVCLQVCLLINCLLTGALFFFQDSIFEIIKNLEYCDVIDDEEVITEHLRLLVNLSATNIAHDEIMTGVQAFFDILSHSHSEKIQVSLVVWI